MVPTLLATWALFLTMTFHTTSKFHLYASPPFSKFANSAKSDLPLIPALQLFLLTHSYHPNLIIATLFIMAYLIPPFINFRAYKIPSPALFFLISNATSTSRPHHAHSPKTSLATDKATYHFQNCNTHFQNTPSS